MHIQRIQHVSKRRLISTKLISRKHRRVFVVFVGEKSKGWCEALCVGTYTCEREEVGEDTFSSERVNWQSAIRLLGSICIRMANIPFAGGSGSH